MAAFSLIEAVFALGVAATVAGAAAPQLLASIDDARAVGAARYVSARLYRARMDAIRRNAATAVRFSQSGSAYTFTEYLDGNRNGVLSPDIQSGVDTATGPPDSLAARFAGVEFGAIAGLPPVDPGGVAPGSDPIRLGAANMAVFTPDGTATSGTLYLTGRTRAQYAVRVFGETGRIRILKFNPGSAQWTPILP